MQVFLYFSTSQEIDNDGSSSGNARFTNTNIITTLTATVNTNIIIK